MELFEAVIPTVLPMAQVEDMLKRSFLEFHAQKAAPEAAAALARGQSALAALRSMHWPALPAAEDGSPQHAATRAEVQEYVAVNSRVEALSRKLQVPFYCFRVSVPSFSCFGGLLVFFPFPFFYFHCAVIGQ